VPVALPLWQPASASLSASGCLSEPEDSESVPREDSESE
jgi:hypothetical protein